MKCCVCKEEIQYGDRVLILKERDNICVFVHDDTIHTKESKTMLFTLCIECMKSLIDAAISAKRARKRIG